MFKTTPWICRQCLRRLGACSRQKPGLSRFVATSASPDELPISPALLSRAKSSASEYSELSKRISQGFDSAAAKRLGELSSVAEAFRQWEKASSSVNELKALLRDPDADPELRDLASEDLSTAAEEFSSASQALAAALVPRHPFADLPCLVEIRPGAGGSEAALFAGDLLRMYQAFCANEGLRVKILKYEDAAGTSDPRGSDAPLQEAILEVETPGAYGLLRSEGGVHRVQRVPATESKGRTHTSTANVLVLPSFPANDNDSGATGQHDFDNPGSDYYVSPQDVKVETMRASGAGGQHVNTTDSAVRLTHLPTGMAVACQDERSQQKNRATAWKLLRARLAQARREQREEERLKLRRTVAGTGNTGRSDKVRTYNWGQQRVTDHRSGISVLQLADVMDGGDGLGKLMESVRAWFQEQELEAMLAEEEAAKAMKQ